MKAVDEVVVRASEEGIAAATATRWRCSNGHVRGFYIKSEAAGGDVCQACGAFVRLAHPDDTEALMDYQSPEVAQSVAQNEDGEASEE